MPTQKELKLMGNSKLTKLEKNLKIVNKKGTGPFFSKVKKKKIGGL